MKANYRRRIRNTLGECGECGFDKDTYGKTHPMVTKLLNALDKLAEKGPIHLNLAPGGIVTKQEQEFIIPPPEPLIKRQSGFLPCGTKASYSRRQKNKNPIERYKFMVDLPRLEFPKTPALRIIGFPQIFRK